jgi:hypothetical protein
MPGYNTVTGESTATVSMGAGTSLFRKLLSVGAGFTITGFDVSIHYGGEASAASTGLITGTPSPDLQVKWGLSYGPSVFTPPTLLGNADDPSLLWWSSGPDREFYVIAPATTSVQYQGDYRVSARSRYQFRLPSASDFCVQIGNNGAATLPFGFLASLRVSYA